MRKGTDRFWCVSTSALDWKPAARLSPTDTYVVKLVWASARPAAARAAAATTMRALRIVDP
jgi:hypothetical protein